MASWGEILDEMDFQGESVVDKTRKKYIEGLSKVTNRNTIIYYSAFLTKSFADNIDINDSDIEGFMAVMNGIDCSKGLDLVLHTPGGDPTAAESIVNYLKSKLYKSNRSSSCDVCRYDDCLFRKKYSDGEPLKSWTNRSTIWRNTSGEYSKRFF